MALVDYSDSEESGDEKPQGIDQKPVAKQAPTTSTNFAVDKSNPRKIRVNLTESVSNIRSHEDEEPAAKRPRVGGGGLSGFNAMLPAPKRDAENKTPAGTSRGATRKVFSLKTGAEPGFSRESDAELKQLFADKDETNDDKDVGIADIPKKTETSMTGGAEQPLKGNAFMFKPLSVARNPKKKKPANGGVKSTAAPATTSAAISTTVPPAPAPPPKKISLFSAGEEELPQSLANEDLELEDEPPDSYDDGGFESTFHEPTLGNGVAANAGPQSLDSIASDLKLSAADRRQLFGRGGKSAGTAINIVNFNTDQEYAANEEMRAAGEQVQHRPVRAIAPGKHSLKQLVSAASGQKEALEESFASGRRNKKEAGNKYGW